ncbi:pectin acetylesterase-family hydrolase, partial [Acinetobacter bereziniae]|uniref:pectin acetylesterase-family hydrolase n=1 Tax=Acinetobacter bereziniae TaxID=106648 RepID=UPI001C066777
FFLVVTMFCMNPSYAWNPFKAIGSAVSTIISGVTSVASTVTNSISEITNTVKNTAENVLVGLGIGENIAKSTIESIQQFAMNSEPGDYSFVQGIINLIYPNEIKANNPITSKDNLAGYNLPKVDLQITKNLPFKWQKVQLSKAETGASCSDGSDYKFFVNLTPTSNNFVIFMEPGGACFDLESCSGNRIKTNKFNPKIEDLDSSGKLQFVSQREISNPNGVSDNYPSLISPLLNLKKPEIASVINPVLSRISLLEGERLKMQNWNYIFLPYCSGDVHLGDAIRTFIRDKDNSSKTMYFNGTNNLISALGWMRNNMPKPAQVYLTGQSAGAVGVDIHRATVRYFLDPKELYTLADSGFAFPEDANNYYKDQKQYPGALVREKMRTVWMNYKAADTGLEKKPLNLLKSIIPKLNIHNTNNLGVLINQKFPNDRISYAVSLNDLTFSGYAYQYNDEFDKAAIEDGDVNNRIPNTFNSNLAKYSIEAWSKDLIWLKNQVDNQNANVGYYMPSGRRFSASHVLTAGNYDGVINDDTKTKMIDIINNLVDRSNPKVIREKQEFNKDSGLKAELSPLHKTLEKYSPHFFPGI